MRSIMTIMLLLIAVGLTACGGKVDPVDPDPLDPVDPVDPVAPVQPVDPVDVDPNLSEDAQEFAELLGSDDIDMDIGSWEDFEINPDDYLI